MNKYQLSAQISSNKPLPVCAKLNQLLMFVSINHRPILNKMKFVIRKSLFIFLLTSILFALVENFPNQTAKAQVSYKLENSLPTVIGPISGNFLSNGQFVYGPNVGMFNLDDYFDQFAPHLKQLSNNLNGRLDYYSINPRLFLTLLEVHGQFISNPDPTGINNPFDLDNGDFFSQVDEISNILVNAYYLHLYTYSSIPVLSRNLPPLTTRTGMNLIVDPDTNAGSYAIMAALTRIEQEQNISTILDNSQPGSFFQTYKRLFPEDDPISETNHISLPGEINSMEAPYELLQLPYPVGESWKFNGVHDSMGGAVGSAFVNAASIDFGPSPSWPVWGADTSNMWVVAAASGIPTKVSACNVKILHSDGWETSYYHLENIQNFSGSINKNEKIAIIANTIEEALCTGGSSTGPHLHFSLRHNGAYVAINGTALSGWFVHSGRWNYDGNRDYMWLEKYGTKKYTFEPLLNEPQSLISQVSVGAGYTCVLTTLGTVKCWGNNSFGQLGIGTTDNSISPSDVVGLTNNALDTSTGTSHTCLTNSIGEVNCWGDNSKGQLGDGTIENSLIPITADGLSNGALGVSAGLAHSCSLSSTGAVKCWGDNSKGQLGVGTSDSSLIPIAVIGFSSGVQKVTTGMGHSCALTTSGAVQCWGDNTFGQLGDGSTTSSTLPVPVIGFTSGVTAISTRANHNCALTSAGAVKCWGSNTAGELGDGSTTIRTSPVQVLNLTSGVISISAGGNFSCALTSERAVKCWGFNDAGQLGNGTTINSLTPIGVTGLSNGIQKISGGTDHACAVTISGIVKCWGNNSYGQLGDGTTTTRLTPVNVVGLTHNLNFIKGGNGSGRVISSPIGLVCGTDCYGTFVSGTIVLLTATASTGSTFTGWSGEGCSGTGTCAVTMDAAKSVTASFSLNKYPLNINKTGSGTISSYPAGLNCGPTCSFSFDYNTLVTLYTATTPGSNFTSWGGACSGSGSCQVTMSSAKSVDAIFTYDINTLNVSKTGTGSGTVTSSPAGINCGSSCSAPFSYPITVILTATPAAGSTFTGWSGYCSGSGSCQVPMTATRSVSATFMLNTFNLSVAKTGAGNGTISSSPAGINCGSTCSFPFSENLLVTLSATPASSKDRFSGWSGEGCSGTGTCVVTMSAARSVTANFEYAVFDDVPFGYTQTLGGVSYNLYPYIQALWNNGFTNGIWIEKDASDNITYALYGPTNNLNRGMVAKFLLNVVHGRDYSVPPLPASPQFNLDNWSNPDITWAWPWAEELLLEGLTNGCYIDPDTSKRAYCPTNISSRAEAAKFGLTMKHGSYYLPPDASGTVFADMLLGPPAHWGIAWAEQAYAEGLLPACGTDIPSGKPLFCPDDPINRAWSAYLIVKSNNLPLP